MYQTQRYPKFIKEAPLQLKSHIDPQTKLIRKLSKDETQTDEKHLKTCSTSLAIKDMLLKKNMKFIGKWMEL